MTSKKLRLEMDSILESSNSSPSGSGLANAGTSASASGGGAGTSGSGGPFRGRYTRPLGGGSLTPSSRFSPYSISRDRPSASRRSVPLIRSRRDVGDKTLPASGFNSSFDLHNTSNSFGSTSSTAQKIMETLANMSTPVLNAGRVRIDSIKALKPLSVGSPVLSTGSVLTPSSKFSGPPKTASPLLLPKGMSGIRNSSDQPNWSLKCLGVAPKLVDSGTNTEESMSNPRSVEPSPPPTYNQHQQASSTQASSAFSIKDAGSFTKNSWMSNKDSVKEKFKFSEPWSINDIAKFVERKRKLVNGQNLGPADDEEDNRNKKKALINGDDGRPTPATVKTENSFVSTPFVFSSSSNKDVKTTFMSTTNETKWECPSCMVFNKSSDPTCVCCTTPKPAPEGETRPSVDKIDSGFKASTSSKWSCSSCWVQNEPSAETCVCCSEKNPNHKKTNAIITSSTNSSSKWNCPTCMVPNDSTSDACVCCTEPNPNKKKKTDEKISPVAKKWECPACMVHNEASSKTCVCCTEPNPNSPVDVSSNEIKSSSVPATTSAFKFGFSSTSSTSAAPSFVASSSNFTFGSSPPGAAKTPASTGFTFGATSQPSTTTASSSSTGFVFGFQNTSKANQNTVAPTLSTSTATTTANASSGSTGFSFGAKSSSNSTPSTLSSPIGFGSGSSELQNKSELTPKSIELWKCDVCASNNKIELHSCGTCASPRPRELDPNYKKPEEKSKTDLKFEPVFGGVKPSASVQPSSAGAGSVFSSITPSSASGPNAFGSTSAFGSGSGTTFSSANPFGGGSFASAGGSTFGSGTTFGSSSSAISTGNGSMFGSAVSTTATSKIGGSTELTSSVPPFSTPGGTSSSQGFQFGAPASGSSSKRKLDYKDDSDTAKKGAPSPAAGNFMFGTSSSTQALKTKEPPPPYPSGLSTPAASGPPPNNAGFLEALKNASAAVKASTEKQSNTVTSTSGPPPSKIFEFGSSGTSVPSGPGFGGAATPNPTFTFGSGTAGSSITSPIGMNQIKPPSSIAPPVAVANPPAPFNLTPNFNFGTAAPAPSSTFTFGSNPSTGAAASNPPPALFQFSATGGPGGGSDQLQQRKIKRATRRFNR